MAPRPAAACRGSATRNRVSDLQPREEVMFLRLAVAAAAALIAIPGAAGAQVLMEKNISIRMALTIAETALTECGNRTSIAVVDRSGRMRLFLQGDGAAPHNLELARRKAYTAGAFLPTSPQLMQRTETHVPRPPHLSAVSP